MDLEKLNNDYLRLKVATEKFKTILEQYENLNYKIRDLSEYNPNLSGSADLMDFNFYYSEDYFKKMMDVFTRSYEDRFKRIEIPLKQPQDYEIYYKIRLQREDGSCKVIRRFGYEDFKCRLS